MRALVILEHDGHRMSQSGVILDYLAERLGQYGGRNAEERRDILRWILFDNHKLTSYTATLRFMLTFQSRFGFDEWLKPYTDKTMERLAQEGVRRIAVITPGFSADCLETLEEIAQENAEIFKHNGGEEFAFIPCLNDSEPGMDVIRQLVLRELQGWI